MLLVSGSTRTVSSLASRWPRRLGHLLTPNNRNSVGALVKTGLWWAADNGAFRCFDDVAFRRMLERVSGAPRLLWIVCPDVVADAQATLNLYDQWRDEVGQAGPVAFVLQDGQEGHELPPAACYFIGGSTEWKLSRHARTLAATAKRQGSWLHMGRVNSLQRMRWAYSLGCDSIDGSSASMFGDKYIHRYLQWMEDMDRPRPLLQGWTNEKER